jgi:hypothetical protein
MPFEPQHIRARKLTISDLQRGHLRRPWSQASGMTYPVRLDGGAFASIGKDFYDDLDRSGKGHPWATLHQEIARSTAFGMGLEVSDFLAGWLCAFCLGADTITGVTLTPICSPSCSRRTRRR